MKTLNIDLDNSRVFDLLFSYFKAKKLFPKAEMQTEISSSGRGFHILMTLPESITQEENFFCRAVLGDCEYRLVLSMGKYYLNPKERYVDLIYTKKGGKKVERFDLERILARHKKDVELINKKWGTNMALEKTEELSKKVEKDIPVKRVWMTCFAFSTEALREKLKQVCDDISLKDSSFRYKIYQSYFPDADYVVVIYSDGKDKAYQRGAWFLRKAFSEQDKANVKKFGKGNYYWTKEKVTK